MSRNDDNDDRRGSRRGRDEEDRGSRGRDDERGGRDRDRDDDRGSRGRDREDDDRGGRSRGGSSYSYERRSGESVRNRAAKAERGDFDRIVKDHIKQWKPNDGDNRIRILPPTWKKPKPEHYGYDLKVHYGVGADRQTYLCLHAMTGEADPIYEAYEASKRELNDDENNKSLKEYVQQLKARPRVGVFLIDRDHEKDGVQFWAMPKGLDDDIVQVMQDKRTGEVLNIDDPDEGYDIEFRKKGQGKNTEYLGVAIARRPSPLGDDRWLEFATENPIPDQLVYFDYDHIAKAFGGGGSARSSSRDGDDRDRDRDDRGRDRDRDDRGRDRDRDERPSRDRDDDRRGRGRDDDDRGSRGRDRGRDEDRTPTWESVHDMTRSELEDLIEQKDLKIKPKEAKDDADLADWVCEELKIDKPEKKERRRVETDDPESDDKLRKMRERRERD